MTDQLRFFPLMAGQMDFWQEWREQPGRPVSTVAHAIRLDGPVNREALARAITATLAETDVAALRFRVGADGMPQQAVDSAWRPVLRRIDLSAEAEAEADAEAQAARLMQDDIAVPLDLLGPMSAHWLIQMPGSAAIWYLRGHHVFLDGYAMALIEARCAAHYAAALDGVAAGPGFAPLETLLDEDRAHRDSTRNAADRAWWQARLRDARLPTLQRGHEDYAAEPLSAVLDLNALSAPLTGMAAALRIGWPDLLTLLAGLCLQGIEGRALTVWLPWMGRLGSIAARVPAMVVNILPLTVDPAQGVTLGQALAALSDELRQLRRHGRYRIEDLSRDLGLGEDRRFFFSPLINVMPFDPPLFPGCTVGREVLAAGPGDGTNLTFAASGRAEGLEVEISADPALTGAGDFARLRDALPTFLTRATAEDAADRPLAGLMRGL